MEVYIGLNILEEFSQNGTGILKTTQKEKIYIFPLLRKESYLGSMIPFTVRDFLQILLRKQKGKRGKL